MKRVTSREQVFKFESVNETKEVNRLKKMISRNQGLLYILPWILGFLFLQLYPLILSLYYSFSDLKILNTPRFIGFENYIYAFKEDPVFYKSLKATFIYVGIAIPLKLTFALIVAMILNVKFKFISLYRTIYYIPSLLGGSVAVAIIWRILFAEEGIINGMLIKLGLGTIPWLSNPNTSLLTISMLTVWQFGSSMVIFLAALKNVPNSLYEAARIDGAGKIRTFFSVTVPIITPVILFNLIMQLINSFQEFTSPSIITKGGPLYGTYLMGLMIYENAFELARMGYAASLSWILCSIILFVTGIIFATSKKWVYYNDGGK